MFYVLLEMDNDKIYLLIGIEEFRVYKNLGLSIWVYVLVISWEVEILESLIIIIIIVIVLGEIIVNFKGL